MHPTLSFAIQGALIFAPVIVLLFLKAKTSSTSLLLGFAILLALATGGCAFYLASEHAWLPVIKSGWVVEISPPHLFWLVGGSVFVVLLIGVFSRNPNPDPSSVSQRDREPSAEANPDHPSASTGEPPPLPVRPAGMVKGGRATYFALIAFYSLGLLAWPVIAYMALFIFGDKRGNPALNVPMAVSIWIYPLLFAFGCWWGHYKKNRSLLAVILKTSPPLLSALWYFLLPGGVSLAWQFLTEEKITIAELESRHRGLQDRLDPIYRAKMASIRQRRPEQDAATAIQTGHLAYLPSTPGGDFFAGLEPAEQPMKSAAENHQVIAGSAFLSGLEEQLANDPSHDIQKDTYFSPVYKEYLKHNHPIGIAE